jgi:hypothetical protein
VGALTPHLMPYRYSPTGAPALLRGCIGARPVAGVNSGLPVAASTGAAARRASSLSAVLRATAYSLRHQFMRQVALLLLETGCQHISEVN